MRYNQILLAVLLFTGFAVANAWAEANCTRRTFQGTPGRGGAGAAVISVVRCDESQAPAAESDEPRYRPGEQAFTENDKRPQVVRIVRAARVQAAENNSRDAASAAPAK
jgi:hypothetical protein